MSYPSFSSQERMPDILPDSLFHDLQDGQARQLVAAEEATDPVLLIYPDPQGPVGLEHLHGHGLLDAWKDRNMSTVDFSPLVN